MRIELNKQVRWGYIIAFLLLLVSYFLIFFAIQQVLKESNSVTQGYSVINKLESLQGQISDAETGVRGYWLSPDTRYLKPYNAALRNIPVTITELRSLIEYNKQEKLIFDTLDLLIQRKLGLMATGLQQFQMNSFAITDEWKRDRVSGN